MMYCATAFNHNPSLAFEYNMTDVNYVLHSNSHQEFRKIADTFLRTPSLALTVADKRAIIINLFNDRYCFI